MFKSLTQALPRLRRRFRFVDVVLSVHERVGSVGGGAYSSALALAALLSLFPLILVLIAVVGFFSVNDVNLAHETVDHLGLSGDAAHTMLQAFRTAEETRRTATIVGVLGLAWAGLAVVDAASAMVNRVWQVTGRGIVGKLNELGWLAGAGTVFLASIASGSLVQVLPGPAVVPTVVLGLVLDTLLCLWTFHALSNVSVGWRTHMPGAIAAGLGLSLLKLVAGFYVPRIVATSSALYGSIGVVFAVLAWFVLGAKVLMYATAYNVVRYEERHGTQEASIEVPHIDGKVPRRVTRGGAVAESAPG
jgi:membrane protein